MDINKKQITTSVGFVKGDIGIYIESMIGELFNLSIKLFGDFTNSQKRIVQKHDMDNQIKEGI